MLEDHNLQCLHLIVSKPEAVDKKCEYPGFEGVDAFIRTLVHIQEELVSEVPEMLLRLDCCGNGIKYLPGGLLLL